MGYAIIRVAKRTARPSVRGMLRHALREAEVANAVPGQAPEVLAGDTTSGAALARLSSALKAAPRVRKDTVQALDVLVTASHDDMLSWPKERQDAYFRKALGFVADRFGGLESVLTATIHRDESTPHMQVLIMPRAEEGRFVASKLIGGPPGLRQMHDEFHAQVGQEYGLLRGERGINVHHVPIRKFYATIKDSPNPLPDYVHVPPMPTWPEKLMGKGSAMIEARKAAISKNADVRNKITARAKAAGQLAPAMLAKQAARYRAALEANDQAKARNEFATQSELSASKELQQAKTALQAAQEQRQEAAHDVAVVTQALSEQSELKRLLRTADTIAKNADPRYLQKIGLELGIELQPSKSILDQVRRELGITGQGATLEALRRLDDAAEAVGSESVSAAAWRQTHREDESPAPGM